MKKGFTLIELMIIILIIGILFSMIMGACKSSEQSTQDFHSEPQKEWSQPAASAAPAPAPDNSGEVYARYRLSTGEIVKCKYQKVPMETGRPVVDLWNCEDNNSYYAQTNVTKLGGY